VDRLAMEIGQQADMQAKSEGLRGSLGTLHERTDQAVKILAQS